MLIYKYLNVFSRATVSSHNVGRAVDKKPNDFPGFSYFSSYSKNNKENKASGAGISLIHQPIIIEDKELTQGKRPATVNMPDFQANTDTHKRALEHGIPFVSGISGSTNIMLYLTNHLKNKKEINLDPKHVLLGTIMFLTYDGGHSIHEALWTANQLDKKFRFGFDLSKIDPLNFVADYNRFIEMYKGHEETHKTLKNASETAWSKTIDRFEKINPSRKKNRENRQIAPLIGKKSPNANFRGIKKIGA